MAYYNGKKMLSKVIMVGGGSTETKTIVKAMYYNDGSGVKTYEKLLNDFYNSLNNYEEILVDTLPTAPKMTEYKSYYVYILKSTYVGYLFFANGSRSTVGENISGMYAQTFADGGGIYDTSKMPNMTVCALLEDVPSSGSSGITEISTATEMDNILANATSTDVGKAYMYVGETNEKYENKAIYLIKEE